MDNKKLDFNAPLLSVRVNRKIREAPQPVRQFSLPSQKSDWELTEVAKPAAVPFIWEQTPGRPKNGSKTQSPSPEESSVTPIYPPSRIFDNKRRVSGEQLEDRIVFRPHNVEASPMNENVKYPDTYKNSTGSLSDDEAYSDALDRLLESETDSWNCSVSGYDGTTYVRSARTFSADPQTREIMMTRFLPAARAMAVETERKKQQPMASELPRHVKKVLSGELRPILEKYGSNNAILQSPYKGSVATEAEDDECTDRGRKSIKACGLLPRLCVKNSVCLLDPVAGMKSRAQSPIPSRPEFRRMARTTCSGPLPQTHHEKHDWNDVYWKKIERLRVQPQEPPYIKLNGVSEHLNHNTDVYERKGLSPQRRSRGGGISPFRNEKPQSPFYDGARFLGIPKIIKNNEADKKNSLNGKSDERDVSVHQIYKQELVSFTALAEKTVHIDPLCNAKQPNLDLVLSEVKGVDRVHKKTEESRQVEGYCNLVSDTQGEKITNPRTVTVGSVDVDLPSCLLISKTKVQAHTEWVKHEQNINQEQRSMEHLLLHAEDELVKSEETHKLINQEMSSTGALSPKPPPLPKSPSESWLWRTLPSVSLRNPFIQDQSKKQNQRTSKTSAKWETIVKASHVHHEHLRHSEELISHVSQHSKT